MSGMIEFSCGGRAYEGYLATSATGKGPGLILIQEWWGLVGHIQSVAYRFAQEGFTVLAPDLYGGATADEPDEAESLFMALNIGEAEKILACAVDRLLQDPATEGSRAGVVGFCMGGQLSLYAACANPDRFGACVDFYGVHPNVQPALERLSAPLMGIFAEHDEYASPAVVQNLDAKLTALGKAHEFHTYAGTHHAFFNDERPRFDATASHDAWAKVTAFLRSNL